MMHIALVSHTANLAHFRPLLKAELPEVEVSVWPDPRCLDAEVAVGWNAPPGIYARMPRLRLVHSIAAGVDSMVAQQDVRGLQVCRVIDPDLAQGMAEYVLWSVLLFHRGLDLALAQQREHVWKRPVLKRAAECRVGVMGLGELGRKVAGAIAAQGYQVHGWSRSQHMLDGVTTHAGSAGLGSFLAQSDVLVCLLPLTDATRGILGRATFEALPRGAALVNCGRGGHLVVEDLAQALASGQLRGAVLDVFAHEPLPVDSLLWNMPGVIVTPHMATMAMPATIVRQIAQNITRLQTGQPLRNIVDLSRGY
ncbi:MAG: glyoxylate/hydroxypyruvate reductase A [Pusillimonas sp.]